MEGGRATILKIVTETSIVPK